MNNSQRKICLIINADDLGGSEEINEAIFSLIAEEHITSATIMANGPAMEDAVLRASNHPSTSFGVHLNVTDFTPLCDDPELEPLLDDRGEFTERIFDIRWLGSRLAAAIQREWSAQIECVRQKGVSVSHLDSHQHVHTLPALFPVLKRVQLRHGIQRVRNTKNIYSQSNPPHSRFLLMGKKVWTTAIRHIGHTKTTEGFCDFATFHEMAAEGLPCNLNTVEVMVHPGATDTDFIREIQLLRTSWLDRLALKLISWHEI